MVEIVLTAGDDNWWMQRIIPFALAAAVAASGCGLTARFAGTFEDDRDQIAGDLVSGSGHIPLRLVRSEGGRCAGAKPSPQAS